MKQFLTKRAPPGIGGQYLLLVGGCMPIVGGQFVGQFQGGAVFVESGLGSATDYAGRVIQYEIRRE